MGLHRSLIFVLVGAFLFSCFLKYESRYLEGYKFPVYTTEFCPRNQSEWNERSSSINCNDSNGYMCMPNENITQLIEFCFPAPFTWIEEGICLVLLKSYSKFLSYNCSQFRSGCHSSAYTSDKSFEHPSCTAIGIGCFLAETTCTSTIPSYVQSTTEKIQRENATTYGRNGSDTNHSKKSTKQIYVENERINSTNELFFGYPSFLGILVPICTVGVLFLLIHFRRHIPSQKKYDLEIHIEEEEVPFIQGGKQHDIRNSSESPRDQAIFEQWQQDNRFFISTRASEEVEQLSLEQNLVIVTGYSGSGKSAIIQHIALKYRSNGWIVKPIDEIDEFLGEFSPGKKITNKTIFVFNDPIGNLSIDEMKFNKWNTHEGTLKACLKKVKLVVSCRKYILNNGRVKGLLKDKSKIVDITQDQLKLNNDEKQRIWNIYSSNKISFTEASAELFNIEAYFPLLCKLYFSNDRSKKDGLRFFKEPREVLEEEIKNFRLHSKETYCALVLLVLFNGVLDVEDILETETSREKFTLALEFCEVRKKIAPHTIADILNNLKGFLVKKIGNTFYFYHDFVMEVTTYDFGQNYPKIIIKYADIGFLRKRVRLPGLKNQNNPLTVYLEDKHITDLGKRLYSELFGKDLLDVVLNPCLKDEKVIEVCIEELKRDPLNLAKLLEKKRLHIEEENCNKEQEQKKLISSRFAFMKLESKTSPLNNLIVFGHTQLSLYCLQALKHRNVSFKDHLLFSSVCCNGSLDLFNEFSADEIQECLTEKWGKLYPIYIAATFHNSKILHNVICIHEHLKMNVDNKDGWTLLMLAAAYDSCDFDENFKEETNETRRNETVQLILKNGAIVNRCDKDRTSPLFVACQEGHESTVQLLLKHGAKINLCDKDGTSPLLIACQEGHEKTVQLLLKHGAKINLCDKDGTSPFFVACQEGHEKIVQLLLKHGAKINLCDKDGTSPLSTACQEGRESTVKLLLKHGAKINLCDNENASPLFVACQEGHERIVQLLVTNEAKTNQCDEDGISPLFTACQEGHKSTVQFLLKHGAKINLCDNDGTSPLFIACQEGHESTVQLLLCSGAQINLCDKNRVCPLFITCQKGHDSIVQLLFKKGALPNINIREKNGITPLYVATALRHCKIVKMLLECGADTSVFNDSGPNSFPIDPYEDYKNRGFSLERNNIFDDIFDSDSFFSLFLFCRVERMLRVND